MRLLGIFSSIGTLGVALYVGIFFTRLSGDNAAAIYVAVGSLAVLGLVGGMTLFALLVESATAGSAAIVVNGLGLGYTVLAFVGFLLVGLNEQSPDWRVLAVILYPAGIMSVLLWANLSALLHQRREREGPTPAPAPRSAAPADQLVLGWLPRLVLLLLWLAGAAAAFFALTLVLNGFLVFPVGSDLLPAALRQAIVAGVAMELLGLFRKSRYRPLLVANAIGAIVGYLPLAFEAFDFGLFNGWGQQGVICKNFPVSAWRVVEDPKNASRFVMEVTVKPRQDSSLRLSYPMLYGRNVIFFGKDDPGVEAMTEVEADREITLKRAFDHKAGAEAIELVQFAFCTEPDGNSSCGWLRYGDVRMHRESAGSCHLPAPTEISNFMTLTKR
ncbi:MAG: hypothetical protein ACXWAC_07655 [Usitatibacter sp.]